MSRYGGGDDDDDDDGDCPGSVISLDINLSEYIFTPEVSFFNKNES